MQAEFQRRGWAKFPFDPDLADWAAKVRPVALAAVHDPANAHWLRCQGTWFAGVNVLPNDASGAVGTSGPLQGQAVHALAAMGLPVSHWDRAQISVTYPGYPRQSDTESDAAFRFRRTRDAVHVDGLLPVGRDRRRHLREPHAFVLGLPLTTTDPGASPLVVWQGSQNIIRAALAKTLAPHAPDTWPNIDLTEAYHTARRQCFNDCPRILLHAQPGEAYVIHRLALHGVAPWDDAAKAPAEGRMIAYFRPELPGPITDWLSTP